MPEYNGGSVPPLDDKFLKERYDYELARKEKLSDSLGMPVSVVIVLGGLVITMIRGFSYTKLPLTIPFVTLVGFDAISFVCCLWFFAKAYHGQTYEQLPSLGELNEARQKLIEYYRDDAPGPMDADIDFEDNFRYRIIEAADRNTASNNARQSCLHTGIVWLFALLVWTAVSSLPYAIDQFMVPAKVPVMHLDNLDGGKESLMPTQRPAAAPAPRPQPQSNPSGPKPQFPSNVILKNDHPVKETRDE